MTMQRAIGQGVAAWLVAATLCVGCQHGIRSPLTPAPGATTTPGPTTTPGTTSRSDRSTSSTTTPADGMFRFFVSPSDDIACVISVDTIRCDITESDWPRPERPADCQLSYGRVVGINPHVNPDGPAQFLCVGDSARGSNEPLAYGASITAGPMRCDSAEPGITCRNVKTGHGFSISREAYQLF